MSINRRTAIKQAVILAGAMTGLHACSYRSKRAEDGPALKNMKVSSTNSALLGEIVETIIPSTYTSGGQKLKVDSFVLLMADDCLKPVQQERFEKGLLSFDGFAEQRLGKSFIAASLSERQKLLQEALASNNDNMQDIKFFISRTRQFSVQGYTTSAYFMTEVVPYQLVPGHFTGCVPV